MDNTDAVTMLKQAAERLRAEDGMPAIDPGDVANFLEDTAEGLPPRGGVESSEQEFALRIAHAVLTEQDAGHHEEPTRQEVEAIVANALASPLRGGHNLDSGWINERAGAIVTRLVIRGWIDTKQPPERTP